MEQSMYRVTSYLLAVVFIVAFLSACSPPPSFLDHHGNGVELANGEGRWTVINAWADWCDPCREEIPELNALGREGTARVIGVDYDGSQGEQLEGKIKKLGIEFPVLISSPLEALNTKSPQVLPATFIVNPGGQLVETLFGPQTQQGLKQKLSQLQQLAQEGAS